MKARSVCCKKLVDTKEKDSVAKNKWGEFLVCGRDCKEFLEMATEAQMKKMTTA